MSELEARGAQPDPDGSRKTLRLLVARADGTPLLDYELAAGTSFEWHEHDPMLALDQVGLVRLSVPPLPPEEAAEITDADIWALR